MRYSTQAVREHERFDYWQDAVGRTYRQTINQQLSHGPFDGYLEARDFGPGSITRIQSRPVDYSNHLDDAGDGQYFVSLSFCDKALVSQRGLDAIQNAGDLVVLDSAQPYHYQFPAGDDQVVLTVPRGVMRHHIPHIEDLLGQPLSGQTPLGRLSGSMLAEAWNLEDALQRSGGRLLPSVLDVLSTALDGASSGDTLRRDRVPLERVQHFLQGSLEDSTLTIATIARETHLSPRSLNRLFARQGTTVMRWLLERRLEASYRGLQRNQFSSVSEAAMSCGFINLSHFSRAFKKAYGFSPQTLISRN
ncbi:helix-turn-helix domain-containing protein [Marinobacter bohaiensis]|uniref:helix-turn-helix domain-containing protein n=1 Tax=Marinobacter bohaiensis TaxID=2201898 RepID=UPI0013A702E5|nr:helix-turn-helix domain-containing protein [Marinobacter bohaiensis]